MRSPLRLAALVVLLVGAFYAAHLADSSLFSRYRQAPCAPESCESPEALTLAATATPLPDGLLLVPPAFTDSPPTPTPSPTPLPAPPRLVDSGILIRQYGSTVYPSIEAMPEDLRVYFAYKVQEVATFFNVRSEDILAILQAQNEGGFRLQWPVEDTEGAQGVAQVTPRLWNGWATPPEGVMYLTDLRLVEQQGGVGFDWTMRELWRAWQAGRYDGSGLARANADPRRFENSVAAIARYLVQQGLTQERAISEPAAFEQRLAQALVAYGGGESVHGLPTPQLISATEPLPLSTPLRESYRHLMDRTFGIALDDQALARVVDSSTVAAEVLAGSLTPEEGAYQLLDETTRAYLDAGYAARSTALPLPWPFIYDEKSLAVQRLAVDLLGHTLAPWEIAALLEQGRGSDDAIRQRMAAWAEARLYASARLRMDEGLQRSQRGLPLTVHEVSRVVQPALVARNPMFMDTRELQLAMDDVERAIRLLPEFRELNGILVFKNGPLSPMPRIMKGFGSPASYQPGGVHTGLDMRNPRVNGQEPPLFAVDEGRVVHVGPLYCHRAGACRGGHAIMIDHGNHVYSIYSHNSAASVSVGDQVVAGQEIGRQGNEGYSRGSHLHFEVHMGAPYSGDWTVPFYGGEFVNPAPWLPRGAG